LMLGSAGAFASDWTASIGNGHTTSTTIAPATPVGSPASAHWSASIGTGQVTEESSRRLYATTHVPQLQIPAAHWTAKIGTARASESSAEAQSAKSTS